jgi:hypothetical protein
MDRMLDAVISRQERKWLHITRDDMGMEMGDSIAGVSLVQIEGVRIHKGRIHGYEKGCPNEVL